MQLDLREQVRGEVRRFSLPVGGDIWQVFVYGVTRVGPELFIQIALLGPRTCTATIRVRAAGDPPEAARETLTLIRSWLLSGDTSDHVFLESPDPVLASC